VIRHKSTNGGILRQPEETAKFFSTNGAVLREPRATPWEQCRHIHRGPRVRPKCSVPVRAGFQPSMVVRGADLGRCPRLAWGRALPLENTNDVALRRSRATVKFLSTKGAALREPRATAKLFSTNGAALREPRATPWEQCPHIHRGPKVRPKCSVPVTAGFQPSMVVRGADLGRCPRLAWGRALPLENTNGAVLWEPRATAKFFSTNGAALRQSRVTVKFFSTNGAALREPRATPWEQCPHIHRGPTVQPKCSVPVRAGFQPSMVVRGADLGRCPRLAWGRALPLENTNGAVLWEPRATAKFFSTNDVALRQSRATAKFFSTNGAVLREPRATPWEQSIQIHRGPKVRPKCSVPVRAGFQPSMVVRGADLGRCPRLTWGRALPLEKGGWR
jgi:hypothetical protein